MSLPADFALTLVVRDGVAVATVAGELDRGDTEGVHGELLNGVAAGVHGLVCDLSSVSYIDSAGVHLLHRLGRALPAADQWIALVLPTEHTPQRVLEMTGITDAVPLFASVDEAITLRNSG